MNTSFHSRPISPPPTVVPWNFEGVTAGFFGRRGGVSAGAFAELNLSQAVGDDPDAVAANWNAARIAFGKDFRIARVRQVHGHIVRRILRDFGGSIVEGDAMVTSEPGVMLGILTADCVPILMIDRDARVAGAVHAGWRGIIAGIVEKSVDAMVAAGASRDRTYAALGPAIDQCCFEVDEELAERFASELSMAPAHRRAGRSGKAYLDLRRIACDQLHRAGIEPGAISIAGPCTRCASDRFFSRRAAGGEVTGLQLSFVGFDPLASASS